VTGLKSSLMSRLPPSWALHVTKPPKLINQRQEMQQQLLLLQHELQQGSRFVVAV
jgi:hypothetical protein